MNDLLSQVHPQTRGLIWLVSGELKAHAHHYKDVDYLLNGLLTATLNSKELQPGQVLVSENFGKPFFVMITQEVKSKEISNFEDLIGSQISNENEVLVIDELGELTKLLSTLKDPLKSKIRPVK